MSTCTVGGCQSALLARGFCRKHYLRWYRYGDPSFTKERAQYAPRGKDHGGYVHGEWNHPLYKTWWHMLQRCENPLNAAYKNYGARGITVCRRWHDIASFIADMGDKPVGASLERKNNNRGYSPSNCVWATATAQSRNRRFAKLTLEKAEDMRAKRATGWTRKQLAAEFAVSEATVKKVLSGAYWRP